MAITTRAAFLASCLGVMPLTSGLAAPSQPPGAPSADPALIAHGKYLATTGDCEACHTAPNGQRFAGGLYMNTPFGPISTPNITPDRDTGIGNYTDGQFIRLFHQGINAKGERIYPVMPFPWYTKVRDDDTLAIKAYLFSLQPVHAPRKPIKLAFPFNVRAALVGWDAVFLKTGVFKPDPHQSDEVNRGAYLVQGLGHCGECHNGRNLLGDTDAAQALQGGPIDKWYAPNITSDPQQGIGKYSNDEIYQYLKTGQSPRMGVVVGPMAQTMHESLAKLTDADLHAIVAYLKSTPAKANTKFAQNAAFTGQRPTGGQAYLNYCASCHQENGKGLQGAVPALAGNGAVLAGGAETIIKVVLGGIQAQATYAPMPAVGVRMTDQEVADAVNYVRQSWGNTAPAVTGAGEVASLRPKIDSLMALNAQGGCPTVVDKRLAEVTQSAAVQTSLKSVNLQNILQTADDLIARVRKAAPDAKQADIINSLTIAYCPIVEASSGSQADKVDMLDQFSVRIYTQISSKGKL